MISDLTTNHTGDKHEWFTGGERELYLFDESGDYEAWWGVKTLPKLNWRSAELRRRIQAVARKWLEPPYSLDGWRVDVANMSGRTGATDVNAEVAPTLRDVLAADSLLVAEHSHDFRPDFRGWHGVMNYAGFSRPIWTWLRGDAEIPYPGLPVALPRLGGEATVATMRAFRAGVPWDFVLHSWTILDSHDTARFRTVAGSRDRQPSCPRKNRFTLRAEGVPERGVDQARCYRVDPDGRQIQRQGAGHPLHACDGSGSHRPAGIVENPLRRRPNVTGIKFAEFAADRGHQFFDGQAPGDGVLCDLL